MKWTASGSRRAGPPGRPGAHRFPGKLRIWVLSGIVAAAGCGGSDLSEQISGEAFDRETSFFDKISSLDYAAVATSYDRLDSLSFQLDTETHQVSDDGRTLASESRRIKFGPEGASIERVTAHGDMADGFMTFAISADSIPDQSRDLIELWVPEEPAFSSARNREYYRYSQGPDTLVSGEPCHTFSVEAIAGVAAEKMPIRHARLVVARSDSALLWLRIGRQDDALFYKERSTLQVLLRRSDDSFLLPVSRDVSVVVDAPLRSTHHFASKQMYRFGEVPAP